MPITPDLFTTAEAAQMLGLKPSSVRYAIKRGVLTVVKIDERTNAVTRQEIERYRREHLGKRGKRKTAHPAHEPNGETNHNGH